MSAADVSGAGISPMLDKPRRQSCIGYPGTWPAIRLDSPVRGTRCPTASRKVPAASESTYTARQRFCAASGTPKPYADSQDLFDESFGVRVMIVPVAPLLLFIAKGFRIHVTRPEFGHFRIARRRKDRSRCRDGNDSSHLLKL
jgi:hypothetical protein